MPRKWDKRGSHKNRAAIKWLPCSGCSWTPGHQDGFLFVFESHLTALERRAEWTMVAIHRPDLLAHVGEMGARALPTSPDCYSRHLLGEKTASLEGPKAPGAEPLHLGYTLSHLGSFLKIPMSWLLPQRSTFYWPGLSPVQRKFSEDTRWVYWAARAENLWSRLKACNPNL